ncbi:hypothetical protein F183_A29580 [Bryobacterales bacterium F-183]|nr:hypothetical protein F183_A29580 [Bryobacterales bacterium F-183]
MGTSWGTRGLRSFFLLATLFPLQGAAVLALRQAIKGEEKQYDSAFAWYGDALAAASVLGVLGDILQTTGNKRWLEFLAGPSLPTLGDTGNLLGILVDEKASGSAKDKAIKRWIRRHAGPIVGPVLNKAGEATGALGGQ